MPPWPPMPSMNPNPSLLNRPPPNFAINPNPPPPPGCDISPPGTHPLPFGGFDDNQFGKKTQPPLPPSNAPGWGNVPSNFIQPPLPSFLPPPPPPE